MTDRVESLCGRLKLPAFHLHGGVAVRSRPSLIREFSGGRGPAVFISTDAGGLGLNLQAADVVINLDVPWNPARLEQRIARVHRIGSKRPVQELLLATRDSIEERILHLHETKRNVLANIWAKDGQDVIDAPGGSGAFRQMVDSLLKVSAPGTTAPATQAAPQDSGARAAAVIPDLSSPASRGPSAPASVSPPMPPIAASALKPAAIDAAALAGAVAAVAPTLPPEHRQSLATVFRALAEALDGTVG